MWLETIAGVALAGAGALAWGVRGRSSSMFASSVWRGPKDRRALAITFDDGPSESTREVLELLAQYGARATFFQCGYHVRRLPRAARDVASAGHEIGNHTDTHPALYLRSEKFIQEQIERAQQSIEECTGQRPRLFRAPYGARWFGLGAVQKRLGLTGVMWTTIARDWALPADRVVARLRKAARPGAILCLHDGRILERRPDVSVTLAALAHLLPEWRAQGYEFLTISEMFSSSSHPARAS